MCGAGCEHPAPIHAIRLHAALLCSPATHSPDAPPRHAALFHSSTNPARQPCSTAPGLLYNPAPQSAAARLCLMCINRDVLCNL